MWLLLLAALTCPERVTGEMRALERSLRAQGVRDPESFLLGDRTHARARLARPVVEALAAELKLDARCVPVFVVDGAALGALHRGVGGRVPHTFRLDGFELEGRVFVRRSLGFVSAQVLVHEVIHALSRPFSDQAQRRGFQRFIEGVTQYYTVQVMVRRFGASTGTREIMRIYARDLRFAAELASAVGDEVLRRSFFEGDLPRLEQALDAKRGKGSFSRALIALESGELRNALRVLGAN